MEIDLIEKSREYIQDGQLEKAQVLLRRILMESPHSAKALELSGDLSQRMGKRSEALGFYEQASAGYADAGSLLDAIICLEKVVKIENPKSDRYVRLAQLYKQVGLPNQGIQKMIELCSRSIDSKDEVTFIAGVRRILDLQPRNLRLGMSYVRILNAMGNADQAEAELRRLRDLAEEMNEQSILSEINRLLPQTDGGDEGLDPKSRVELGNLLYEIGSKDEALVEFNKAVSDLVEQGEHAEAINVLNRIIEIDPSNESAFDKLRELQIMTGAVPSEGIMDRDTGYTEAPADTGEEGAPVEPSSPFEGVTEEVAGPDLSVADVPAPETVSTETGAESIYEEPERTEDSGTEELGTVPAAEAGPLEPGPEESEPAEDIFNDLIKEVENYVERVQKDRVEEPAAEPAEEQPSLEGQIADIEFLLKEMESPQTQAPSFEVAAEFDDFRGQIVWEEEDVAKRLELARLAFDAELYDTALFHAHELRMNKNTWPTSLEITGAAMIKLGKYSEAIKTVGPAILLEDIPRKDKIELRYLLAGAYEGLGDFQNALREIEHIMSTNPDYKDVKEMYELLGGKSITPEPVRPIEEMREAQVEPKAMRFEPVEHPEETLADETVVFEEPVTFDEPVAVDESTAVDKSAAIEEASIVEEPTSVDEPTVVDRPLEHREARSIEEAATGPTEQEEVEEPYEERGENISFL